MVDNDNNKLEISKWTENDMTFFGAVKMSGWNRIVCVACGNMMGADR